jgi:hypothetical protein
VQWQSRHFAGEGLGQSTDFWMIGHKGRQGTTVALDDDLIVALFHRGKTAQLIEGGDRGLKSSGDGAIGSGIATGQVAATGAQQGFNSSWRKTPCKGA